MIYPILFLVIPRLWHVCHKKGYLTLGDSCADASAIAG
jgi:solute:Na+ symporter, SSS family